MGSGEDLDELVKEYYPKISSKVKSLVPPDDVEDVVQDIFLNLVRSIGSFRGEAAFSTWFGHIVANRIADYYRKAFQRKNTFVPLNGQELSQEPNTDIEFQEFLMRLPERYSEVLFMKFYDCLTFGEIANILGETSEAVHSRYRRAIEYARLRAA